VVVDPSVPPRFRVENPHMVALCLGCFLIVQIAAVFAGPDFLMIAGTLLVLGALIQRITIRRIARVCVPVLVPALITAFATRGETAAAWQIREISAVFLTATRFLVIVIAAYLTVASCAVRSALLSACNTRFAPLRTLLLAAWFVLSLAPESSAILREARAAALFRPGIPVTHRIRAMAASVLQRLLVAAHTRADSVVLRLAPDYDRQGIPPSA